MLPKEIEVSSRDFQNLMKTVHLMTNMKDKIQVEERLKTIQRSFESQVMRKEDEIFVKKLKKKMKALKLKNAQQKVVVENHVTKKHFALNFHGISDLFVSIFGS